MMQLCTSSINMDNVDQNFIEDNLFYPPWIRKRQLSCFSKYTPFIPPHAPSIDLTLAPFLMYPSMPSLVVCLGFIDPGVSITVLPSITPDNVYLNQRIGSCWSFPSILLVLSSRHVPCYTFPVVSVLHSWSFFEFCWNSFLSMCRWSLYSMVNRIPMRIEHGE